MKVIWNNTYTTIEWKFMKISFVTFWLNAIIIIFIKNNFIPMPIGVLSFLQPNSSVDFYFKLMSLITIMIAIYFYISEKHMIWITLFLFLISVLVFTIEESNGIFRRNDLFSLDCKGSTPL